MQRKTAYYAKNLKNRLKEQKIEKVKKVFEKILEMGMGGKIALLFILLGGVPLLVNT